MKIFTLNICVPFCFPSGKVSNDLDEIRTFFRQSDYTLQLRDKLKKEKQRSFTPTKFYYYPVDVYSVGDVLPLSDNRQSFISSSLYRNRFSTETPSKLLMIETT